MIDSGHHSHQTHHHKDCDGISLNIEGEYTGTIIFAQLTIALLIEDILKLCSSVLEEQADGLGKLNAVRKNANQCIHTKNLYRFTPLIFQYPRTIGMIQWTYPRALNVRGRTDSVYPYMY